MLSDLRIGRERARATYPTARHYSRMGNNPEQNPGGDGETIEVTAASGGEKASHMGWVLGIGTALSIAGMLLAWFILRP